MPTGVPTFGLEFHKRGEPGAAYVDGWVDEGRGVGAHDGHRATWPTVRAKKFASTLARVRHDNGGVTATGDPILGGVVGFDLDVASIDRSFVVFAEQDSGCVSYGVELGDQRWFVKRGTTADARRSLARAVAFHAAVRHDTIVAPHTVLGDPEDPVLVYPWCDGVVLNHATVRGSDRSGLARFQELPLDEVVTALTDIIDAHLAVAAAGMVAVDLYDGCLLYDFSAHRMHLIDLDEYRPGPFVVSEDRLPGSRRYMAPEEFVRGAVIDQRTTVFTLGRTAWNLLHSPAGWRGTFAQADVVARATNPSKARRFASVADLHHAWLAT